MLSWDIHPLLLIMKQESLSCNGKTINVAYFSGQCNAYGGGGGDSEVEWGRGVKRNFGGHAHSPALAACSYSTTGAKLNKRMMYK